MSVAWKLMTKDKANETVQCNLCSAKFKHRTGGSTTNLKKHLSTRHQTTLQFHEDKERKPGKSNPEAIAEKRTFDETMKEQMVLEASSTSFAGASSNPISEKEPMSARNMKTYQPTVLRTFEMKEREKYKPTEFKKKKIDDLILQMVTMDLQPISIVEDRGFKELLNFIDPRYPMVSRKHLTQTLLPTKYHEEKTKLMMNLSKTDFVSITTDQWTSKANEGYTTSGFLAISAG